MSDEKKAKFVVAGIIAIIVSAWGAAFAIHTMPDWCFWPILVTTGITCLYGIGAIMLGVKD